MTKNQELAILDNAIAALGKDSYCGPWLANVRHEVEQSLRSDLFPDFSVREARVECEELKKKTEEECKKLLVLAESDAVVIRSNAVRKANELATRQAASAKDKLRIAVRELNQLLDNLP